MLGITSSTARAAIACFAFALAPAALAQPAHDDCVNAQVVISPDTYTSSTSGATGFTSSNCAGSINDYFDVWYAFTPAVSGVYRFDMQLSPGYISGVLSLYTQCGGAAIACDAGPSSGPTAGKPEINYALAAGQTVLIRVAMCCGDRWPFTLRLGAGALPLVPPNDECSAAITLSPGVQATGTNVNATGGTTSQPCIFGFGDNRDVWYAFTAPSAGHYEFAAHALSSAHFNAFYTTLSIYDACGGVQTHCGDDADPMTGSRIVRTMAAGENVRVRIAGWAGEEGTFAVKVGPTQPISPPSNDACEGAEPIVAIPYSHRTYVAGAQPDVAVSCGDGQASSRYGVWYTYVAARSGNIFIINDSSLPVTMTVFSGASCGSLQEVACFAAIPGAGYFGPDGVELVAGRRYWLLMAAHGQRELSADVYVGPRIIDRGPDVCAGAQPMPFPASVEGNNFTFHNEDVAISCGTIQDTDAWHEFVAPTSATYTFELLDRPRLPYYWAEVPAISLHSDCDGEELACSATGAWANSFASLSQSLAAGQRVLVRVGSNAALTGTYHLEVSSSAAAPSPNDLCADALAFSPGVGAKPVHVNGATTSGSQDFAGSYASAAAGFGAVTLHNDVWYRWVSPQTGLLGVRTNVRGLKMAAYGGSACPPAPSSLLNATVLDVDTYVPVEAGQMLLFQLGLASPGASVAANLHLSIVPYQGACCTGAACAVRTSTDCASAGGTFQGRETVCGQVSANARVLTDAGAWVIPESTTPLTRTVRLPDSDAFPVGSVAVRTTINHPELSDVYLTLTHAGRTVILERGSGVPNELASVYIFTDKSLRAEGLSRQGSTRLPATGGYYTPSDRGTATSLDDPTTGFGGTVSTGDWTLGMRDEYAQNRGVINGWQLVLLPAGSAGPCGAAGACCAGSTCNVRTQSACMGPGVAFLGAGAACNPVGNRTTPCCNADYNQSGGLAVGDIFDYLNAWLASDARADINGGGLAVSDIFEFLNAWLAGC